MVELGKYFRIVYYGGGEFLGKKWFLVLDVVILGREGFVKGEFVEVEDEGEFFLYFWLVVCVF